MGKTSNCASWVSGHKERGRFQGSLSIGRVRNANKGTTGTTGNHHVPKKRRPQLIFFALLSWRVNITQRQTFCPGETMTERAESRAVMKRICKKAPEARRQHARVNTGAILTLHVSQRPGRDVKQTCGRPLKHVSNVTLSRLCFYWVGVEEGGGLNVQAIKNWTVFLIMMMMSSASQVKERGP